jgi:catechol 2,3-dioxygenase-like lactoylglutathione lyase family enzyme
MINFKRTDHVNICVAPERLEEARLFYKDVMGFTQIIRPDHVFITHGYWFVVGDIEFHVGVEAPIPQTFRHTAFEVTDLAAARRHLKENGVIINDEPVIPGRLRFSFYDPFGNRMELLEYSTLI